MRPLWKTESSESAAGIPVSGTPFEPDRTYDVVVVGAGVTGLSTGLMLVQRGLSVAIIDEGEVAALSTGGNTGKVSLLQGSVLSSIRRGHGAGLVRAYVDANRDGVEWLREAARLAGVPGVERTAYSYAATRGGRSTVRAEHEAAREAGLGTRLVDSAEAEDGAFPFAFSGGVALDGQWSVDPVVLAQGLARSFVQAGGILHTGVRATAVRRFPRPRVVTPGGDLLATQVVLATGTPFIDRGLTFAKVSGLRSSCIAFRTEAPVPQGMYLSVDGPTRSIRAVGGGDGPDDLAQLIVGGAGHPVGDVASESAAIDELAVWARAAVPDAIEVARWSAQDYQSHNLVPFVGGLPRGFGRIRFATGYGKWGLSNGPAAALRLTAEITGEPWRDRPQWMQRIGTRLTVPSDIGRGLSENLRIGRAAAVGWARAAARPVPVRRPAEGEGTVARRGAAPVGVSTVAGRTRAVSAVCPHLGGVLSWNDAECTWDCPLHASRFEPDGTRIEGPAAHDLTLIADGGVEPAVGDSPQR